MDWNRAFSQLVHSWESKVQHNYIVSSTPNAVQEKANHLLEWVLTCKEFFKIFPVKLRVTYEFAWGYMIGKYPHWFRDVKSTTSSSIKEWLLKKEYFEQLKKEISKFKIK